MSFQQGLSGLAAASKSLEAIGNNVANANTVGFKAAYAQFADVYANSLNGGGSSDTGIGTKVAKVSQQFTGGNITGTNNPLDIAINGSGFFRMSDNGVTTYTRNGQFELNREGYIVNGNQARLTGYMADANGVISAGSPVPLRINSDSLAPSQTTRVEQDLNLDSRKTEITDPFDFTDPATYHDSTSVDVYDSLGNSHVLQTFYVKTGPNAWSVYAASDGVPVVGGQAGGAVAEITFTSGGALDTVTPASPFPIDLTTTTGATTPYTVQFDITGSTQYGAAFSVSPPIQDGFESGRLSSFVIGSDGVITGRYTNGKSAVLGQVVLANFTNPNGLQPLGNNAWAETATSGAPAIGVPETSNLGTLQASAVEDSNVDLTAELVNMITAQRVFQANSQTIKTQDQLLQTLVNLR